MTTTERKKETIAWAQDHVNTAKDRLIETLNVLEGAECYRMAKSLGTIIGNLEAWQHKGR